MDRPASKRVTRRDIRQPDRFINLVGRSISLVGQQRKLLIGVASGILLIVAGLWGWNLYQKSANEIAATKYLQAVQLYHSGRYREAVPALDQAAAYPATVYGQLALLHQARSHIHLREYPKAAKALQEFLRHGGTDSLLRQIALVNLGYVKEMSGQCAEAISSYADAEKLDGSLKNEATLGIARCSVQSGKQKMALDSYRRYLSANPESERMGEIAIKVQELEATIARQPAASK